MTTQIDFEQARLNMIEQQIRTWEVLDQGVLDLVDEIHREDFVPNSYQQLALADVNIPLAHDQVMMTPKLEARLLQAIAIQKNDKILEIGTGSAYLTALMAKSAQHVDSVDIFADFGSEAKSKLENYQLNNVQLHTGDALSNWQGDAPYDVIVVTGSVPLLEPAFQEQLAPGGRLFVIVGESPVMEAILITRVDEKAWATEVLFETDLPALIGADLPSSFQL
jgi:protein-L-isoaspartate(D-aspartate) O-methyltransferase